MKKVVGKIKVSPSRKSGGKRVLGQEGWTVSAKRIRKITSGPRTRKKKRERRDSIPWLGCCRSPRSHAYRVTENWLQIAQEDQQNFCGDRSKEIWKMFLCGVRSKLWQVRFPFSPLDVVVLKLKLAYKCIILCLFWRFFNASLVYTARTDHFKRIHWNSGHKY